MIKYTNSLHLFSDKSFSGFCVGWGTPLTPQKLYEVLKSSYAIIIAYDATSLKPIGFITCISDGVISAYIPLLEVLPDYQKQGIGKQLVMLLLDRLEHLYMVDLCCDESLQKFYAPLGFIAVQGMVRRNYEASK